MRPFKLILTRGCRSDYPLSDPIIKAMESDDFFKVYPINLHVNGSAPENFVESFNIMNHACMSIKPDLVIIIGDRIEAAGACNVVFLNNIPICHLGAGITNTPISTYDDILRHNITNMANIALCEDERSAWKVKELWNIINKLHSNLFYRVKELEKHNIHIVGNYYADGLDNVDERHVPDHPYDLILYNPTTLYKEEYPKILKEITRVSIWIGSNPDGDMNMIYNFDKETIFHRNLPRPQYLGLLKNCQRVISNSSSIYYEAPYYLKPEQIIHVGSRNLDRSTDFESMEGGSTEKIIDILKEYWRTQND